MRQDLVVGLLVLGGMCLLLLSCAPTPRLAQRPLPIVGPNRTH
jgi:hypothetical protein